MASDDRMRSRASGRKLLELLEAERLDRPESEGFCLMITRYCEDMLSEQPSPDPEAPVPVVKSEAAQPAPPPQPPSAAQPPAASAAAAAAQPAAAPAAADDDVTPAGAAAELMLLQPRGKHSLSVANGDVVLVPAKGAAVRFPASCITAVVFLDRMPGDKKGRLLMHLALDSSAGVMLNAKQRLDAVVIQTTSTAMLTVGHPDGVSPPLSGVAAVVLAQLLGLAVPGLSFLSPDPKVYKSNKGDAGISAYVKATQGVLFPLPTAFVFADAKPPMFLTHRSLRRVELRRENTGGATFDLVLLPKDGPEVEFGQIDRAELGRIQSYIHTCKLRTADVPSPAGGAPAGGNAPRAAPNANDEEEEEEDAVSSNADDEDFDPELCESGSGRDEEGAGGGGSAAASRASGKRPRNDGASGSGAAKPISIDDSDNGDDEEDDEEDGSDDSGCVSEDLGGLQEDAAEMGLDCYGPGNNAPYVGPAGRPRPKRRAAM